MRKPYFRKKGFTLIELLAVIVILTIIILVAFPNVLGIINNTKKGAFLSSTDLIVLEIERNYIKNKTSEMSVTEVTYTFETDQNGATTQTVTPGTFPIVEVSGDLPQSGTIIVNTEGDVKVDVTDGTNKIIKNFSDESLIIYDIEDASNYDSPYLIGLDANPSSVKGYYFQDKGLLVITGTGATKNYTQVGMSGSTSPFTNQPLIKSVIIEKGVTTIGSHIFMGETFIERITIPDTITYIGRKALQSNDLIAVELPNSVTTIMPYAFSLNRISKVNIPNNLTVLDEAVFWDNRIGEVMFPSHVITIGTSAFSENLLTNMDFSQAPLLTTINMAAFANNLLTNITIPSSVTTIGDFGFFNNSFTSVTIQGVSTRFNSIWTTIGFPAGLMPV